VDKAGSRAGGLLGVRPRVSPLHKPRAQLQCDRDWTLHASPPPAYPSYRLIAVLQLYHLAVHSGHDTAYLISHEEDVLQPWRNVLLGRSQSISEANERAWRGSLIGICDRLATRAEGEILSLDQLQVGDRQWGSYALECVQKLWTEEKLVAGAVRTSVIAGIEF
jgi:hypothetical protein